MFPYSSDYIITCYQGWALVGGVSFPHRLVSEPSIALYLDGLAADCPRLHVRVFQQFTQFFDYKDEPIVGVADGRQNGRSIKFFDQLRGPYLPCSATLSSPRSHSRDESSRLQSVCSRADRSKRRRRSGRCYAETCTGNSHDVESLYRGAPAALSGSKAAPG
jgi:hypothetical protein